MGAAPQQISPDQRVADFRKIFSRAESEVARVIVGHREVVRKLLTALFCGGHILIEGVPGLGKTLMVKAASETLGLSFKRIQFTPDLMPSDIIGTQVLTESEGHREFQFKPGPIFAHMVLGRRDQSRDAQDAIGRARGDGGASGHRLRHDLRPRSAVYRARHAKSDRARRNLSAARGADGSVHLQSRDGIAQARRAARNSQPHHRHGAKQDSAAVRTGARAAARSRISRRWCAR